MVHQEKHESKVNKQDKESDVLLELKNVTKDFGGIKAVNDFSMTVNKGELRCLIGPNGAGKSTIFKLIMGVYGPSSGKVYLNNKEITKLPTWKRARQGLSIKMQIPGVYGDLSLRDNIRIAVQKYCSKDEIETEIDRLINVVGIEILGNPLVKYLSHGQQQWLEMAMSLGSKPELLLLDEPVAGMGPDETEFTAKIIKRLNDSGLTIIFIDHDMEFVRRIAEKVTVLHYGCLFAEGSLEEIEENEAVIKIYLGTD